MNIPTIPVLEETTRVSNKRIGEILIERGLVTEKEIKSAIEQAQKSKTRLGEVLIKENLVSQEDMILALSSQLNVPIVDLSQINIDIEALEMIPEDIARKSALVPLATDEQTLVIAMAFPDDIRTIRDLTTKTGKRIQVALASSNDITNTIDLYYRSKRELEHNINQMTPSVESEIPVISEFVAETPVAQSLELILKQAIRDRASDVHVEPQESRLRIRYRIDGILHDMYSLPVASHSALISRIKILSEMNIAEHRRPQDGQFSVRIGNKDVDIRSSTMLTAYGERVALRILDKSLSLKSLDDLGILPHRLEVYRRVLKHPFGIILVGGPTGSGKTTTLYSFLNQFNRNEKNIITIEDPIEYRFTDINQTQVNVKADLTFATGLRTILRHDPDIVLVGEIRDKETASIATQAALTGRLVLASIHANDAISIIYRLIDLGVEPFLVSATMVAAISQRMVRRICPYCKIEYEPKTDEIALFEKEMGKLPPRLYIGSGCNMCAQTGFRGRVPLFEIVQFSEDIRRLLLAEAGSHEIRAKAIEEGMITMMRDGMKKASEGLTSISEVIRNAYSIE